MHFGGNEWQEEVDRIRPCFTKWKALKSEAKGSSLNGLTEKNYRIIDLSEDLEEYSFSGKLGNHYVNREWKNADFRIAFGKNKTHSYARYTLTLKIIYGTLPLENKFLEYHHKRDIYSTTIEFIKHFPIHFALIDAYVSAEGPFGIFADKNPNYTKTIIGSEDPVATDWIGAAKMGLDSMISDYVELNIKHGLRSPHNLICSPHIASLPQKATATIGTDPGQT
jgi:uncharacterized protein (DUF362 family)